MPPPLALAPYHDAAALAARFAEEGRIQIADFLAPQGVDALRTELAASARWRHVMKGGATVFEIARPDLEALPRAKRDEIDTAIHEGAASGFQFRYDVIRVPDSDAERRAAPGLLPRFARLMGERATLGFLAAVTGLHDLGFADAQATGYRGGDFLTRHDDLADGKARRLAYVYGLTRDWQPEWGGLLQFNDADGGIARTIVPRFNALSLFRVPQPHGVSYVAPFAGAIRLSITGWVRACAPPA
jgi:hypothetical protein